MPKTSAKPSTDEEKMEDSKKASKAANKKAAQKKIDKEAKKLAEKAVVDMAAELPAGEATSFLQDHAEHQKAEQAIAAAQKWKRTVRARMKQKKIDMACYDRVNKLFKMEKEDRLARKATEALYEKQLGLELSPEQEAIVQDIEIKRENARAAMAELHGNETGKEIGSGDSPIGHNSKKAAPEDETPAFLRGSKDMPAKNDEVGKKFRGGAPVPGVYP